jgi:hypothetical protein
VGRLRVNCGEREQDRRKGLGQTLTISRFEFSFGASTVPAKVCGQTAEVKVTNLGSLRWDQT